MRVINQYRFIHLVSMQWDNKTKIVFIHNKIVFCQHKKSDFFYWHNGKNKLFNEYLTGYRWLPDRRPPCYPPTQLILILRKKICKNISPII